MPKSTFPCSDCERIFLKKAWLKRRVDSGACKQIRRKIECPNCGVSFSNKWNLKEHVKSGACRSVPTDSEQIRRKIECPNGCGGSYKSKGNLKIHIESGACRSVPGYSEQIRRKIECPNGCGSSYTSKGYLKIHIESGACHSVSGYSEEARRKIKCPNGCGASYMWKKSLKNHIESRACPAVLGYIEQTRHKIECPNGCGRTYKNQAHLTSHIGSGPCARYNRIECPNQCGKTYMKKSTAIQHFNRKQCTTAPGKTPLQPHVRLKVAKKPLAPKPPIREKKFECQNQCGNKFTTKGHANDHFKAGICTTLPGKTALQPVHHVTLAKKSGGAWLEDTSNPLTSGITYEKYRERYGLVTLFFDASGFRARKETGVFENKLSNNEPDKDKMDAGSNADAGSGSDDLDSDADLDKAGSTLDGLYTDTDLDESGSTLGGLSADADLGEAGSTVYDWGTDTGLDWDDSKDEYVQHGDDESESGIHRIDVTSYSHNAKLKRGSFKLQRQVKIRDFLDIKIDPESSSLAIENQAKMEQYNIAPPSGSSKCRGLNWWHGTIACLNSNTLTQFNCHLTRLDPRRSTGWT